MTRRIKHDKFDRSDRLAHHDVDSQDCQCDFHRFLGAINRAVRHGMTSGIHSDKGASRNNLFTRHLPLVARIRFSIAQL